MPDFFAEPCDHTITGNPAGHTLVFIHGWPDDASLWRQQVEALESDYRCVLVTLPNFGNQHDKAGGYGFPELVAMLNTTLDEVRADHAPVILVTHDWGAYLGFLLEQAYPEKIGRMIALDIGGHVAPSGKEAFFILGYQWTLVLLWLIGGINAPLGDWLTQWFASKLKVPERQATTARSRYNYMYFHMWRNLLLPWRRKHLLRRYRPRCPVLFLWGRKKPLRFHSDRWLEIVEQTGGRTEGIEGAGHWLMESHPERINRAIRDWPAVDSLGDISG